MADEGEPPAAPDEGGPGGSTMKNDEAPAGEADADKPADAPAEGEKDAAEAEKDEADEKADKDEKDEKGEEGEKDKKPSEDAKGDDAQKDKPPDKDKDKDTDKDKKGDKGDKGGVKPLFDSKGSLLETQSFVKEKLEEFKTKRAAVAKLIAELQTKVKAYKEKENPTDEDIANLKNYHAQFLEKLGEYEEMTRNLEKLMGMEDVPTDKLDRNLPPPKDIDKKPKDIDKKPKDKPKDQPDRPSKEDPFALEEKLPKLIVCGTDMGDSMPRIIVCEPLRKKDLEPFGGQGGSDVKAGDCMNKLNECFKTQQKLAAENAEVQRIRHQQQQQLLEMQDMMDQMKQRMMTFEMENRRLQSENKQLQDQMGGGGGMGYPGGGGMGYPGGGGMGYPGGYPAPAGHKICKRELYMQYRGQAPGEPAVGDQFSGTNPTPTMTKAVAPQTTMEQELDKMGDDIANIANDLDEISKQKRNMSQCCKLSQGNPMELGYPMSPRKPLCKLMLPQVATQTDEDKEKDVFFLSDKDPKFKDLREQYQRLHGDFKNKVTEVAALRVELDKTRKDLDDITILHHELEAMHQKEVDENNSLLQDKNQIQNLKDQVMDLEQQANMNKQMYQASQDEMEEMRSLIEDQATQLDEYRNKYMKTLQIAEELKKENEFKERECADQIAVEIQRVKLEMQEQLEELSPIKDLLKITQQKLKETEQMHSIALETIADLSQQHEDARNQMEQMKEKISETEGRGNLTENLKLSLDAAEKRMTELENENARLKEVVLQLEGNQATQKDQLEEKSHELLQMINQLETLREESARQVSRIKERSEMIRKCLQAQIAEMEREVAQSRAATAFANRERDEIRSKLQMEICLLSENFREQQNRIAQLQQHVNYLSASHPTNLIDMVQL